MANELQKYSSAEIQKITKIKDAVKVKDMAEAAGIFYKAQGAFEKAQEAQEIKLRSIRQAGIILLPPEQGGMTARDKGGDRRSENFQTVGNLPIETPLQETLEQAGISPNTAHVWQKVARVPEDKFEVYFTEISYYGDEFTIAGLLKFAGEWYGRSDIAEWQTPQWLFDILDKEFHFTLDVCASEFNHKCPEYYTKKQDGLKQNWNGSCWMNPPYGREIKEWMTKARIESENEAVVVCLVPARTDTEWWWDNCINGEIRFIKGRLKWQENSDTAAPFPSAVIILGSKVKTKVVWWNVQSKK